MIGPTVYQVKRGGASLAGEMGLSKPGRQKRQSK